MLLFDLVLAASGMNLSRKPTHHFGLALIMALIAFFPFQLNPDSLGSIDIAAVMFFGLLAVAFVISGVLRLRQRDR